MSNIIPFPVNRTLKHNLDEKSIELEEYYDALAQLEMAALQIEEKAIELEGEYKKILHNYISHVGLENTEIRYLEYGVVTVYSDEEGNFTLESPEIPNP